MEDKVRLLIGEQPVENFLRYTVEADIYTADDAFSVDLADPEVEVAAGQRCKLYVNDELEMTGIIDRTERSYSKEGTRLTLQGRDLCGLLVDSCCEQFTTVTGMTLKALAERLLATVPFIQRGQVVYQENTRITDKGKQKKKTSATGGYIGAQDAGNPQAYAHIEPGQTIFEVLREYAASRGLMFFAMPDGTFVFGRPKAGGEPLYTLICRQSAPGENNVLTGALTDDISRRYSKITVMGQQQGQEPGGHYGTTAATINTKATVTDPTFPFYKPYVTGDQNDGASPAFHAQGLMDRTRFEGFQLTYRVAGHSQGVNWRINEMCHVIDEPLGIEGDYLIYGRTFEMSKDGAFTVLKLSHPGVIQ